MPNDDNHGCKANTCPHTQAAADKAVKRVFAILGVDVDVPKEVESFREDLRFGGRVRRASDRFWVIAIGVIAAGIMLALWDGIRAKVGL